MKIAVSSRHGRLLVLCTLSAAVHLLCLELVAHRVPAKPAPAPGDAAPLVLRLAPLRAPAASLADPPVPAGAAAASDAPPQPRSQPQPPAPPARSAAPANAQAPRAVPAAAVAPDRPAPDRPAPERPATAPAQPAPGPNAAPALAAAAAAQAVPLAQPAAPKPTAKDGGAPSHGNTEVQTLLHYRVSMPPAVRLDYTLTRRDAAGHTAPAQPAWLDWRSDGERYRLEMDGVLGRLGSSGVSGDEGILPQRFIEQRDGRAQGGSIDPDGHRVLFADGSAAPDAPGIQDWGSLLMQLAGIGLARPAQVDGEIEVVVAGQGQARVEHFVVMGRDPVDTGAGRLMAWRLAQKVAAGAARLEVWLAPDQGWLPVQLRITEADGASATQVLARSPAAPAP